MKGGTVGLQCKQEAGESHCGQGHSDKWEPNWIGPYILAKKLKFHFI